MTKDEDSLGMLLGDVHRQMRRLFLQQLEGSCLTQAQSRALVHISRCEGMRQVDLAEKLDIQPITLARQLDQLAESGLIERRNDPNDRRAYQLFLTDTAAPYLERLRQAAEVVHQRTLSALSAEEVAALYRSLETLRTHLSHS